MPSTTNRMSTIASHSCFLIYNHAGWPPQDPAHGAVSPNLGATLDYLRRLARCQPELRLRVLVTGSLYLVGDVLRLLGKVPK